MVCNSPATAHPCYCSMSLLEMCAGAPTPPAWVQVHTLSGLRGLLDPSGVCGPTLAAAAQAQALRAAALQTALEHNQVSQWHSGDSGSFIGVCVLHWSLPAHTLHGRQGALLSRPPALLPCLPACLCRQVLLDWVVRKLDRRRRVVMWRAAAVEGVSGGGRGGLSVFSRRAAQAVTSAMSLLLRGSSADPVSEMHQCSLVE
jgi:hypothetical protein